MRSLRSVIFLWLLLIVCSTIIVSAQDPNPTPTPTLQEEVLIRAQELLLWRETTRIGNCISGRGWWWGDYMGCLQVGLHDVGSATDCADIIIATTNGYSWRVGTCEFSAAWIGQDPGWLEDDDTRDLAAAVHWAAVEMGLIPPCERSSVDEVLDYLALGPGIWRYPWDNCLTESIAAGHSGSGCLTCGLEDVGYSGDIICETTGYAPYYETECYWRSGTCEFGASSHDDTEYSNAARGLAYTVYSTAMEFGLIAPHPTATATPTATPSPTPPGHLAADLNRDGQVDHIDLLLFRQQWSPKKE